MLRGFVVGTALLLMFPTTLSAADVCARADSTSLQVDLERATQAMLDAVATGDKRPWTQCLADDALLTGDDGVTRTKAEFLADLHPLPPGYTGVIRVRNASFRHRGTLAVLSYDLDEAETIFGHAISQRYHTTDTWTADDGEWRIISSQALRLHKDPDDSAPLAKPAADVAGVYQLAPTVTYTISMESGQLYGQRSGRDKEKLFAEAGDVLFRKGSPGRKIIQRNAQGAVIGFLDRLNGADLPWERLNPARTGQR